MVYLAASINDSFLGEMEREPYPFVLVGAYVDGADLPCFRTDDREGGRMATKHLISLGHKSIGHIAGSAEISTGRDRELGYRDAMAAAGLTVQPSWVVPGHFDTDQAERVTNDLLMAGVTAIFAGSDVMAYGALRALKTAGRRVPNDVAVVGMDDLEMSAWVNPALTTVRYDVRLLAELATKYLMRRIQSPVNQKPSTETPAPELIVRESCGAKK